MSKDKKRIMVNVFISSEPIAEKKTDLRPTYEGGVIYYKLVKAVWDHGG